MNLSRFLRLGLIAVLSLAFLAGCGDDDTDDAATDDTTEDTTEDTAEDATEDTTEDEEPEDDGAEDENAAAVTEAYTTFFDGFTGDPALLEDGESFDPAVMTAMQARSEAAGGISVDVKGVNTLDDAECETAAVAAPCAEVNFDMVVGGTPSVPDQTGYAIEQDGNWKVAKTTFCALASLGSGAPEGC